MEDKLLQMSALTKRMEEIRSRIAELNMHSKPTEAQEAEFRALDGELQTAAREHILEQYERGAYRVEAGTPGGDSKPEVSGVRGNAQRMIERSFKADDLPAYAAEKATQLVTQGRLNDQDLAARWILATGDEHYRSAFAKLCADPTNGNRLWDERELAAFQNANRVQQEMRAMSLTDNAGGYLVPFQLDPAIIITNVGTINPLRAISKVVQATGDVWNGVTSAGVTAQWLAEATEAADASPTLGQPNISNYKGSAFVPYSYEVGMDTPNFLSEVGKLLADGAERLQATGFTTGSGIGQPVGIVTALDGTASEIAPTTPETFAAADIYKVQNALPPRYQANARWMAALATANSIDQFETTNGAKKFPDVAGPVPTLLRKPFHENSDMDSSINPAATADNFVLVYGDFSNFIITDRIGSTVELIPNLMGANRRPTGQRGLFLWFRTGSDSVNDAAFVSLNVATTA